MRISTRETVLLQEGWKFCADIQNTGLENGWMESGIPETMSTNVQVPHTWNVYDSLEDYCGAGWYQYDLRIDDSLRNKRIRLRFEGVYRDADVWLNGRLVGQHYGSGYTPFDVDISKQAVPGRNNRLIVRVDNRYSEEALPYLNKFDWPHDGGILRDVHMIISGDPAIDMVKVDPHIHWRGRNHGDSNAAEPAGGSLDVTVTLWESQPDGIRDLYANLYITGPDGSLAWSGETAVNAEAGRFMIPSIELDRVQLWHFDSPNLYALRLILCKAGLESDEITVSFGFRELKAVGRQIFFNREPVRLTGAEWMPGSNPDRGMAETKEDMEKMLRLLKEANCVLTRFHWQQSSHVLEWCDRNGILVQEEIPLWQSPSAPDEKTVNLAKKQLDEMIGRHYNHPCIIAWGVGNELHGHKEQTVQAVQNLKAYASRLDPHRMVNYVSNTFHLDHRKDASCAGDVLMWNEYAGTWNPDLDLEDLFGNFMSSGVDKPIMIAEFGLCEPAFTGGDERRSSMMVEHMNIFRRYDFIAGTIAFSLNDYRTHMGEGGTGKNRLRIAGSTDMLGGRKPSFSVLKDECSPLVLNDANRVETNRIEAVITARNDLPSYGVNHYKLFLRYDDRHGQQLEGTPEILNLNPGESVTMHLDLPESAINPRLLAVRPTGFVIFDKRLDDLL